MLTDCAAAAALFPVVFLILCAGPPLDVWSMGVILFAILCGRLPFEGPDLVGTKRPREQIIKSRIMKSQYKLDDSLGPEAKDLVRRMLQVDPSERASIPEIFNHAWVRPAVSGNLSDTYHLPSIAASAGSSRTNPEAGNLFPPALSSLVKQSSTTFPKDDDAPQESAEPISQSQSPLQKV